MVAMQVIFLVVSAQLPLSDGSRHSQSRIKWFPHVGVLAAESNCLVYTIVASSIYCPRSQTWCKAEPYV